MDYFTEDIACTIMSRFPGLHGTHRCPLHISGSLPLDKSKTRGGIDGMQGNNTVVKASSSRTILANKYQITKNFESHIRDRSPVHDTISQNPAMSVSPFSSCSRSLSTSLWATVSQASMGKPATFVSRTTLANKYKVVKSQEGQIRDRSPVRDTMSENATNKASSFTSLWATVSQASTGKPASSVSRTTLANMYQGVKRQQDQMRDCSPVRDATNLRDRSLVHDTTSRNPAMSVSPFSSCSTSLST